MKECHCAFVQSCSWTTALSLVILMPVPLSSLISPLPHHRSCLDLELLVGIRLLTGLTLISVSCGFHVLHLFPATSPHSPVAISLCLCAFSFFPLSQIHQSLAQSSQHTSRCWRMRWQPSHCWSQLTQRRYPAFGCIRESWSEVSRDRVMAL